MDSQTIPTSVPNPSGKNVKIPTEYHEVISDYCKKNGYVMGTFVAIAALGRIESENKALNKKLKS